MSDDKNNKVVQFPLHKVRKTKAEVARALGQGAPPPKEASTLNQSKRVTLAVSLLSTLVVATYMTSRVNKDHDIVMKDFSGRNIASESEATKRDLSEDVMLAKKIGRDSLREPASAGHEPTDEDILRHEVLAGHYAMKFEPQGALSLIEFANTPGVEPKLMTEKERRDFITKWRHILRVDFTEIKVSESFRDTGEERAPANDFKYEVYDLYKADQVQAHVYFKLGPKDQFYSMKVEFTP